MSLTTTNLFTRYTVLPSLSLDKLRLDSYLQLQTEDGAIQPIVVQTVKPMKNFAMLGQLFKFPPLSGQIKHSVGGKGRLNPNIFVTFVIPAALFLVEK